MDKAPPRKRRTLSQIAEALDPVSLFIRDRRKQLGYTQEELAYRTGTSLKFIKSLELATRSHRMDKVNQVLALFGARLEPGVIPKKD